MTEAKKYRCMDCNDLFSLEDICYPHGLYDFANRCRWCSHDIMFRNTAIAYILNVYNLRAFEYSEELLEIEIIRAKTRYVLRTGQIKYITFKNEQMITQVNSSQELRQALNENLTALLTKKRKLLVAKEVNNTLGKIMMDVKMELMQNAMSGNREIISWFSADQQKKIGEQYGVTAKLKNAV